jgi:hypothetical protein
MSTSATPHYAAWQISSETNTLPNTFFRFKRKRTQTDKNKWNGRKWTVAKRALKLFSPPLCISTSSMHPVWQHLPLTSDSSLSWTQCLQAAQLVCTIISLLLVILIYSWGILNYSNYCWLQNLHSCAIIILHLWCHMLHLLLNFLQHMDTPAC